jgi:hypothetical protein
MAGSAFVKIDRLYESEIRARARDAEKDRPIIACSILDFFKQMTGFEPTAYQVALLLDLSQFVVARWSRQSGKSLCLTLICLHVALSGSNRRIAILAPSLRQSRAMIRRASSFLPKLPRNLFKPSMAVGPARPYDNQPAGPPQRICSVCGSRYTYEPGKDSPCGHVRSDGTVVLPESKSNTIEHYHPTGQPIPWPPSRERVGY